MVLDVLIGGIVTDYFEVLPTSEAFESRQAAHALQRPSASPRCASLQSPGGPTRHAENSNGAANVFGCHY